MTSLGDLKLVHGSGMWNSCFLCILLFVKSYKFSQSSRYIYYILVHGCDHVNFQYELLAVACPKFHSLTPINHFLLHFIFLIALTSCWNIIANFSSAEDSLFIRSIFVMEGSILVCIEDLDQFGGLPDDSNPPYFSLDASCSISNIREVVSCIFVFFLQFHTLSHYMIILFHIPFFSFIK